MVPTAAPVDADATIKRPAVTPTPMVADADATMRRPAIPAIDPDQTAPRAPVEVEDTGPRPMLVGDHDIETTAKRVSMPPDLDETARRPPVDPLSPPAASMPARPAPAMPRQSGAPAAAYGSPRGASSAGGSRRPASHDPAAVPPSRRRAAPRGRHAAAGGAQHRRRPSGAAADPAGAAPGATGPSQGAPGGGSRSGPGATRAGRPVNPFLAQDPAQKARRLARALIRDLAVYYPDRRKEGLTQGTLKQLFQEEIQKSWEEFTEQVGKELAESTTYFNDALNEILAGGQKVF